MINSRSLPCAFHNGYLITNFCKEKECLLPLCPKCIRLHNREHAKSTRPPDIESIDVALEEARASNDVNYSALMAAGHELKTFQSLHQRMQKGVKGRLAEAKRYLLGEANRSVEAMESKVLSQLHSLEAEVTFQLVELDEDIRASIQSTIQLERDLLGRDCLRSLIEFHKKPQQADSIYERIKERIIRLGDPAADLKTDNSALERVKEAVGAYCRLRVGEDTGVGKRTQPIQR